MLSISLWYLESFSSILSPSVGIPVKTILPECSEHSLFPTVKYVPEWFPGAGFKKFARMAKENLDDSANLPFQLVKESFQVRESSCYTKVLLERVLGGHDHHFFVCGDVFRGIAGTQ
jgi:hypothetical protein